MSILLKITCQVIARRRANGEAFEDIIKDYPRMATDDVVQVEKGAGYKCLKVST